MKKIKTLTSLLLAMMMLFACGCKNSAEQGDPPPAQPPASTEETPSEEEPPQEEEEPEEEEEVLPTYTTEPSDFIMNDVTISDVVQMLEIYPEYTENNHYVHCNQGGCTDGKYFYYVINDLTKDDTDISVIVKRDIQTGEVIARSTEQSIGHANDMTYNSKTKELVVANGTNSFWKLHVFDAKTLTFKQTVSLEEEGFKASGFAYDPYEDCYWAMFYGTRRKLDAEFNIVETITYTHLSDYTSQGIDVDSEYIYYIYHQTHAIAVYDKETCELLKTLELPFQSAEPQCIFHLGDTFYAGFYKEPGGYLYKLVITENAQE